MKGNITPEQVTALKAAYGDDLRLLKWPTPDRKHDFVFKPISIEIKALLNDMVTGYEKANKPMTTEDVEEFVFDRCVVWPELTIAEKKSMPIGWMPSIVKSIYEKSGYVNVTVDGRIIAPDIHVIKLSEYTMWDLPTKEVLANIKAAAKFPTYKVTLDGWTFVCRPMTRTDINIAIQAVDQDLALVRQTTLWPDQVEWETLPAGIVKLLGEEINKISGWEVGDVDVEEL